MPEHRLRVLVVDDCHDTTDTLAILLRLWGHEAAVAHDGPTALAAAQACRPDVILLDIGLPVTDGYEVGRQLRRLPGLDKAPLVAVTGYGHVRDRLRAANAGFDFHLLKPVDVDRLNQLLTALGRVGRAACSA
jgi:CheY-like chemotaxis protein